MKNLIGREYSMFCTDLFQDHHNHCPCRPVLCRNENCNINIPAWQLTEHETMECDYRPVMCEHCNAPETFVGLQVNIFSLSIHVYVPLSPAFRYSCFRMTSFGGEFDSLWRHALSVVVVTMYEIFYLKQHLKQL